MTQEEIRLAESGTRKKHWKRWGPYLSERAWGTVREDYSAHGKAWEYLPHDHARSRAYRWNEDGLAGSRNDIEFFFDFVFDLNGSAPMRIGFIPAHNWLIPLRAGLDSHSPPNERLRFSYCGTSAVPEISGPTTR